MFILFSVLIILIPYLLGSIPTAVWVSKGLYGSDIRTYGSGNAGSTNMFRVFGVKAGILTQVVDIIKGVLAALIPVMAFTWGPLPHFMADQNLPIQMCFCGLIAAIGHIYPVLAGFRGGKGINTLLGTILVAQPLAGGVAILVFLLVILLTRYVSLGSMLGTLSFTIYLVVQGLISPPFPTVLLLILSGSMFVLVVFTHRSNLKRLLAGNENRANLFRKKEN